MRAPLTYITVALVRILAPVVQKADTSIHRINHYPVDSVLFLLSFIHRIAIYPVDSVIYPLNNRVLQLTPHVG